jgi:hypothetical protein
VEHTFTDGTLSEPLPPSWQVGSKGDAISFRAVGMQQEHASRAAVWLDRPNLSAFALCRLL